MAARICVITTGHIATCPRMLKAADAFVSAGYDVHVVMIRSGGWAAEADRRLRSRRAWHAHTVSYDRGEEPVRWLWSGVRQRASLAAVDALPPARKHLEALTRALSRVAPEIVRVARTVDAAFYYAGGAGAIGLAALAADRGAPWAVDFEDAHGLEPLECGDADQAARMSALEAVATRGAAFVTAAGDGVAGYYRDRYGVQPLVINNVFPLASPPVGHDAALPSLYWFSQTIGPRRGLDTLIETLARMRLPVALTLRGRADADFERALRRDVAALAPHVALRIVPPADPDDMVLLAAAHDVGLSLEDASIPHRAICTPNKLFVYLAAGLVVVASPTPGQQPIMSTAPGAFVPLSTADTTAFELALEHWTKSPAALVAARQAAWAAAAGRWHWDHQCERHALLSRVAEVLQ